MSVAALRRALFVAGIAAAAALPFLGRTLRAGGGERCAMDGVRVEAASRVRVVSPGGDARSFCCVECAQAWLARTGDAPERVQVTDETSGAEVAAADAWFVESRVPVAGGSGSRVHAFSREADAREHAEEYRGRLLSGPWRPFAFEVR